MSEELTSTLLRKLANLTQALDAAKFRHAIGGGIALAFHANPRFTNDIDINISVDPTQIDELISALPTQIVVTPEDVESLQRDKQVRLRWPNDGQDVEQGTPIDIFLPAHPTFHARLDERAEPTSLGGLTFRIVSATDLTILKVLFDRSKDWVDIEDMLHHGRVDVDEALAWLRVLLGEADTRITRLRTLADNVAET